MTTLASFSRGTLPVEFYDVTSRLLLRQPQPQFLYYYLLSTALGSSFSAMEGLETLPLAGREIVTGGDPSYINLEEMQLQLEPNFDYSELFEVDTSFKTSPGGVWQPGHVVRINRPRFTDSTYTMASREIPRGKVISKTPISVGSDQTELTIKLYGGPLGPSGEVQPYAINRLDAQRSVHSLPAVRKLHFTYDYHKTLDSFGVQLLDAVQSTNIFWSAGMVDDNSSVVANDFPFSYELLTRMKLRLDDTNIPVFPNGKRPAVLTPLQCQQLGRDPEFQRLAVFDIGNAPKNPLMRANWYASIQGIDVFRSTTLTRATNTNSIKIHYAQMFGPGALGAAPGNMPEVATNTDDNYGEDPMAIWKQYFGIGNLDDRFAVSGRSSGEAA